MFFKCHWHPSVILATQASFHIAILLARVTPMCLAEQAMCWSGATFLCGHRHCSYWNVSSRCLSARTRHAQVCSHLHHTYPSLSDQWLNASRWMENQHQKWHCITNGLRWNSASQIWYIRKQIYLEELGKAESSWFFRVCSSVIFPTTLHKCLRAWQFPGRQAKALCSKPAVHTIHTLHADTKTHTYPFSLSSSRSLPPSSYIVLLRSVLSAYTHTHAYTHDITLLCYSCYTHVSLLYMFLFFCISVVVVVVVAYSNSCTNYVNALKLY